MELVWSFILVHPRVDPSGLGLNLISFGHTLSLNILELNLDLLKFRFQSLCLIVPLCSDLNGLNTHWTYQIDTDKSRIDPTQDP